VDILWVILWVFLASATTALQIGLAKRPALRSAKPNSKGCPTKLRVGRYERQGKAKSRRAVGWNQGMQRQKPEAKVGGKNAGETPALPHKGNC